MFELIIIISLAIIFFIFLARMPEVEKIERGEASRAPIWTRGIERIITYLRRINFNRFKPIRGKKMMTVDPGNEEDSLEMKDLYAEAERRLRFSDFDKAEKLYLKLAVLNPKDATIYGALGKIYLERENYQDAIASFKAAINRDRKNGFYYYDLATVLAKANRHKEAIICFEKSIMTNNRIPIRHLGLGMSWMELGEYPKAAESFKRALTIEPHNHRYRELLKKAERLRSTSTLK